MADSSEGSPGPSTDRNNDPVVDPSRNVLDLVDAAITRQDDMRKMQADHLSALIASSERHTAKTLKLRGKFAKEIRRAEKEVSDEKFRSIDMQLALIERQRVEQKADTQKAVDAALAAQKEAVREQTTASDLAIGKSENAMTKQVDQQGVTFATAIAGMGQQVQDNKDRISKMEASKQGGIDARAALYTLIVLFISLVGVLLALFAR